MLIILCLYLVLAWLVFSKLKLLKWGWGSGSVTMLGGAFILAVFLAMFNYLTPSGSVTVVSRVVEVTPNVTGQVISIPVKTNFPGKNRNHSLPDRSVTISSEGESSSLRPLLRPNNRPSNSFRTTNRPPPMLRA